MKGKITRKIVACVCSLALAGALVPAMALSAFAADEPVFTIKAQEIGAEASTAKVVKTFTAEEFEEATTSYPQIDFVINAKSAKVYSTREYIPFWELFSGVDEWCDGAYFEAEDAKGVYGKNGPFSYNNAMTNSYFWPAQTAADSKYESGKLSYVEPVLAVSAVATPFGSGTENATARDAARNADFSSASAYENVILMGNNWDNLEEGICMPGNSAASGVTGLTIYYPHNLNTTTASVPSVTYNGKTQVVNIALKDAKGATIDRNEYAVADNIVKKAGTYTAYIYGGQIIGKPSANFKSDVNYQTYHGEKIVKIKVNMKKAGKLKLTSGKKKLTVKWSDNGATKYKVYYKVKGDKKWKTTTTTSTSKTIKNLKKGKKYQVKVVATASGVSSKTFKTTTSKKIK